MNILNISAAVNRAAVRSPYLTQLSSGLVVKDESSGSNLSQTSLIQHIDLSGRQVTGAIILSVMQRIIYGRKNI